MGVCKEIMCLMCDKEPEDQDHLFFNCDYSRIILQQITRWMRMHCTSCRFMSIIKWIQKRTKRSNFQRNVMLSAMSAVIYGIWKVRNECLWQHKMTHPDHCISRIKEVVLSMVFAVKPKNVPQSDLDWLNSLKGCK